MISIKKAIELNEEIKRGIDLATLPDHADAVQLGIEALKLIELLYKSGVLSPSFTLPGEAKE